MVIDPIFNMEYEYLRLCNRIMLYGEMRETRNGITRSLFSEELKFNLEGGELRERLFYGFFIKIACFS